MTESRLPPEIRNRSVSDPMSLGERIGDSMVEDETRFPLTAAQKADRDRRLARREPVPSRGIAWNQVKHRIQVES